MSTFKSPFPLAPHWNGSLQRHTSLVVASSKSAPMFVDSNKRSCFSKSLHPRVVDQAKKRGPIGKPKAAGIRISSYGLTEHQSTVNMRKSEQHSSLIMRKTDVDSCLWLRLSQNTSRRSSNSYAKDDITNGCSDLGNGSLLELSSRPSLKGSNYAQNHLSQKAITNDTLAGYSHSWIQDAEASIERAIFDSRFLSLLGVIGSLAGAFVCFLKGCSFIVESFGAFYNKCLTIVPQEKMILHLVEAIDVYLTGTVMLIFGVGLYGLFISNVPENLHPSEDRALQNSSLFGMFILTMIVLNQSNSLEGMELHTPLVAHEELGCLWLG